MIANTEARWDETGAHFYRRGRNGERIEITRDEWKRIVDWPIEPIYEQVLEHLGVCRNCRCNDCGCVGCGDVDADMFGAHGYACVM